MLDRPFRTSNASKIATSVAAAEMAKMLAGDVHGLIMATSNGPTTPASAATDPLIPMTRDMCSGSAISRYDAAIAGIKRDRKSVV